MGMWGWGGWEWFRKVKALANVTVDPSQVFNKQALFIVSNPKSLDSHLPPNSLFSSWRASARGDRQPRFLLDKLFGGLARKAQEEGGPHLPASPFAVSDFEMLPLQSTQQPFELSASFHRAGSQN